MVEKQQSYSGDDQKTLSSVAREYYGGYPAMFEALGWEWQGNKSMNRAAVNAKEDFGSIREFEKVHRDKPPELSLIQAYSDRPIVLTSMRSWEPELRGGWNIHGEPSRQDAIDRTKAPFLLICYIIKSPDAEARDHADKVMGFLEVTHEKIARTDLDSADTRHSSGQAEAYSLRATRAFEFLPNFRPDILEIVQNLRTAYPDMTRDLNKGIILTDEHLSKLTEIPYKEVPLYGSEIYFKNSIFLPKQTRDSNLQTNSENDPFENNPSVYIKAAYGFHPPDWGCVGWNEPGRAKTLIEETTDPFIMAIWVTYGSGDEFAGKLAGFYEVTHEEGLRQDFTAPYHADNFDEKFWKYSLKASRAWEILPEYQPVIMSFYPEMYEAKQERSTGRWSSELPSHLIDELKALPRREVEVYGTNRLVNSDIVFPNLGKKRGFVRGGPGRRSGYEVSEPLHTVKELYILRLIGDTKAFIGHEVNGKRIYKVGLSVSPITRRDCLNAALPKGEYSWEILKTTRGDLEAPYPDFETAETGEMAMKVYLGENPGQIDNHLGGEFYLASEKMINGAWSAGRLAALSKSKGSSNG